MEAEDRLGFLMRADWLREEGARRAALLNAMDQDNGEELEFNETFDFDAGDGFARDRYCLVCVGVGVALGRRVYLVLNLVC